MYEVLVERDGERCRICNNWENTHTLVIDHIDNNNSNNQLWNLQLLCRSDNARKNPRGLGKDKILSTVCVSVSEIDKPKINSAEFERNRKSEPLFRRWIYFEVSKGVRLTYDEAIDNGAERSGCSQETIIRYMKKMTCDSGPLRLAKEPDGTVVVVLAGGKAS
ncbi:MAG: HNH endonuclease signature motif containing protein [Bacteroidota bacterium]